MKNDIIFWSASVGVTLFIVASILGGLQIEGYSHISQYISESYANGLPHSTCLQYMYILSGLLLFTFAFMASSVIAKTKSMKIIFYLIGIFYGLATMITGLFPCELGCDFEGDNLSISQLVHSFTGLLTYLVVPFCLIIIGSHFRKLEDAKELVKTSFLSGIVSLIFVVILFGNPESKFIGLFQRIVEASILFWIIRVAFYAKKRNS